MTTKSLLCTSAVLLSGLAPALIGCRSTAGAQMAPIVDGNAAATDPAAANFAAPYASASAPVRYAAGKPAPYQVAQNSYPQQAGQAYPQQGNSGQNEAYRYNTQPPQNGQYNTGNYGVQQGYGTQQGYADPQYGGSQYGQQGYDPNAQISDDEYAQYEDLLDPNVPEAQQPPPPLPTDYEQPEAPGDDYLWTPGYWDYASAGYYYVPGAWVAAPYPGALWTPGWWGYVGHGYRWHHGYWGPHVGFYGGVNYGFGYIGFGYQGGYWNNNHFLFNLAVNRVRPGFNSAYTYNRRVTVVNNTYINNSRTSYFGGPSGLHRGPSPQEFAARREQRVGPMQAQIANRQAAQGNRQQFFNSNGGRPQMLTASRPLQADRGIQAPPRFGGSLQPGNNGANGFNRPGFANGNFNNGNQPNGAQQRPGPDQQRGGFDQQQRFQQGQQAERFNSQQQQINNRQADQQFQQRQQQQRSNDQQQQINSRQSDQQFQQRQQQERFHGPQTGVNSQQPGQFNDQQRQGFDPQRQANDQQRQLQFQQQRQQLDQQRQQADANRQQQFQQQRQQLDQQRQANEQQRQQQRQQFDQQRQAQQQLNQQRSQQPIQQHFDAPRPAPSAPRMEAPHMEGPRPGGGAGGGGEHHR